VELRSLGAIVGSAEAIGWGADANTHLPVLHTHDRFGYRLDEVVYHPAYHELLRVAVAHGAHATPWAESRPGAHVVRAAKMFLLAQVDAGHGCPISMTYSAVPALRVQPELAAEWEPRLVSRTYDPRFQPADQKTGALAGRDGDDRETGRVGRAREHHSCRTGRRRVVPSRGPQVVLLGTHV